MPNPRYFFVMALGEIVVLATYVVAVFADLDLSSIAVLLRVLVVVGALVVAGVAYQAWSAQPSTPSLAAMLMGLLGGAILASTVVPATDGAVYDDETLAGVGTAVVVLAVVMGQLGLIKRHEKAERPEKS